MNRRLVLLYILHFSILTNCNSQSSIVWFSGFNESVEFFSKYKIASSDITQLDPKTPIYLIKPFDKDSLIYGSVPEIVSIWQRNHIINLRNGFPNDPLFNYQYYLYNNSVKGADIGITAVWPFITKGLTYAGDSIVIGIIDGGFDLYHNDLIENIYTNFFEIPNDSVDNDSNGYNDDYFGYNSVDDNGQVPVIAHGTEILGIIGAKSNNSLGIAGINSYVKMLPVSTYTWDEAHVVSAYLYMRNMRKLYNETQGKKGAFIVAVSSSFGIGQQWPSQHPIWCAVFDTLGQTGIISTGATLNNNIMIDSIGDIPSTCPSEYLIMVNSTDDKNQHYTSAYSKKYIDIAAPGSNIYTTFPNNTYSSDAGTSFAAPQVAAAIGVIYSLPCPEISKLSKDSPSFLARQIIQIINDGTDPLVSLKNKNKTEGKLNIGNSVQIIFNNYCYNTGVSLNYNSDAIIIAPNPATDKIYVESKFISNINNIYIYSAYGQIIPNIIINRKMNGVLIDCSTLANGIYFIKTEGISIPMKFIINK